MIMKEKTGWNQHDFKISKSLKVSWHRVLLSPVKLKLMGNKQTSYCKMMGCTTQVLSKGGAIGCD